MLDVDGQGEFEYVFVKLSVVPQRTWFRVRIILHQMD